ncbi:MAG: OmpA family protein [Spirochaetota bacterium]|jgi:outer membrane protein OmpA-like peptidoglycan-associated protein|nr:OmpA family protein [Spirochaetota bacterium]
MKKLLACVFLVTAASLPLLGERFYWRVAKDESYRITSYVHEERYLNGKSLGTVEIRNKAVLHATAVSNTNAALYKGEFQYFERPADTKEQAYALIETYPTEFWRDIYGKYSIHPEIFMPVVRDVPLFTKQDIAPGAVWQAEGHEVHDLKGFGLERAFRIPFTARYRYIGERTIEGKRIALFSIMYNCNRESGIDIIRYTQEARSQLERLRPGSEEAAEFRNKTMQDLERLMTAPRQVQAACRQYYAWDIAARLPYSLTEEFHFIFDLINGERYEFKGTAESSFEQIQTLEEREAEQIVEALRDEGVTVSRDERGIVLELGDILFDHDSANLRPDARAKLAEISKRINTSGKFEVRVEGHTDNTGAADYNLQLSQNRARAVAAFLSRALDTDPRNISWIGHGMTRPSTSNSTEAGRAKNRRVEIILLTNE